jgi:DNA-binding NtrC family response regulator
MPSPTRGRAGSNEAKRVIFRQLGENSASDRAPPWCIQSQPDGPDSNDLTLLANVRRLAPAAAVVMMTALGVSEMIAGAEALGASRIVEKPIDMRDLPAIVRAAADSPRKELRYF